MKRLHTFDLGQNVQLQMLKAAVEGASIRCMARNENMFTAAGGVPINECYPELWILDDDDFSAAERVLKAWLAPVRSTPWECSNCQERLEGQFELCWNCGAAREERHAGI